MADVKQELPMLPVGYLRIWDADDPDDDIRAQLHHILALLALLEPTQQDALAEALHPRIFGYMRQVAAYCGADAQLKASQERERIIQDHRERACEREREVRAENEKLRAELATAAERQRRSDAEQHECCVPPSAWPLVTDAPSKPAIDSGYCATCGNMLTECRCIVPPGGRDDLHDWLGMTCGLLGMRFGDSDAIAREIAAWVEEGSFEDDSPPAPNLKESCEHRAPSKPETKPGHCAQCGKHWTVIEHTKDFKWRHDFVEPAPPEHGVNRPGQGKHLQHEAVVMANEAIRRENNQRQLRNVERVRAVLGEEWAARAYAEPGYDAVIAALLDHIDNVARINRELHDAIAETSRQYVEVGGQLDAALARVAKLEAELAALRAKEK